jgi:zinc transport system ATP-binding protein
MERLIGINGLTFGYGRTAVLEDVSLDILDKDYVLVIGPNGGGKTTLLKLILGILKPWSGTISFQADVAGRIGYVPQLSGFNRSFPVTVSEMVLSGCISGQNYLQPYSPKDKARADMMLEKVNLSPRRRERIIDLSGGQLQRVLIARALVSEPAVLLLDEPTASIDITSQSTLLNLLDELNREMAVVVVTHDPTAFSLSYTHLACLNRNLYYHGRGELDASVLEKVYGCPVELLGHGVPHTIVHKH